MHSVQFTYDELATVLAEIEAILNSRPLTQMSSNPNDLQPLTAGHFLIGGPMNCINDGELQDTTKTRMWYKMAQVKHEFWNRWSKEYLAELQQRVKWTKTHNNIKIGQMMIVKDTNVPLMQWKLARITEVYPDLHGQVRVVKIITTSGQGKDMKTIELKRAIHELSPLPIESDVTEDSTNPEEEIQKELASATPQEQQKSAAKNPNFLKNTAENQPPTASTKGE